LFEVQKREREREIAGRKNIFSVPTFKLSSLGEFFLSLIHREKNLLFLCELFALLVSGTHQIE
jgi:hypothetical protein